MGCVLPDNNKSFHPALPYPKEAGAKNLAHPSTRALAPSLPLGRSPGAGTNHRLSI